MQKGVKNPNSRRQIICSKCKKQGTHKAHNLCIKCYMKQYKKPGITCKNCGRTREHGGYGFCKSCHMKLFHMDKILAFNAKIKFGLDFETWKKLKETPCMTCGFDKIVELHHIDENSKNNALKNLVTLCPNCHKLIHMYRYKKEMIEKLKEGIPEF